MRLLNLAKKLERLKKDPEQVVIWAVYDGAELPDPATRQRVVQEARARGGRARYLVVYWSFEGEEGR